MERDWLFDNDITTQDKMLSFALWTRTFHNEIYNEYIKWLNKPLTKE